MIEKDRLERLRKIAGLQTAETVAETLGLSRPAALNRLSRLKKEGYVTVSGGGKQKRLYKITLTKQRPRAPGMFDLLNRYSPMKLAPWYDHQVHGPYGPEEALIDALETKSFRAILASLRLFNHITDWPKLYRLTQARNCWPKVGALYEVARLFLKVRQRPAIYSFPPKRKKWETLTRLRKLNFPAIARRWKVYVPFNSADIREILVSGK